MKCYKILAGIILTIICFTSYAQTDNSAMIADIYQRASKFYEDDKFADAVTLLERAEALSPTPDAKILYLKIKALNSLFQKDTSYINLLEKSIPVFLSIAQSQNYPAQKIAEVKQISDALIIQTQQLLNNRPTVFTGKIVYEINSTINGKVENKKEEVFIYKDFRKTIKIGGNPNPNSAVNITVRNNKVYSITTDNKLSISDVKITDTASERANFINLNSTLTILGRTSLSIQRTFGNGTTLTFYYDPKLITDKDNSIIPNGSIMLKSVASGNNLKIECTAIEITPMNLTENDFELPPNLRDKNTGELSKVNDN